MNTKLWLKNIFGLLAIIAGAVATFDNSLMPVPRYLIIYLSLMVIVAVTLHSVYETTDDTASLEKIKDEQ